jgi:ABC-type transporter Mla MlaB component
VVISESKHSDGRALQFALEGDFELTDVAEVERRIGRRRSGDEVTLDTRELRFLDSSALALLLRLQRLADEDGWSVSFIPGEALLVRARRTGLDGILRFADAPEPAVAPQPAADA